MQGLKATPDPSGLPCSLALPLSLVEIGGLSLPPSPQMRITRPVVFDVGLVAAAEIAGPRSPGLRLFSSAVRLPTSVSAVGPVTQMAVVYEVRPLLVG